MSWKNQSSHPRLIASTDIDKASNYNRANGELSTHEFMQIMFKIRQNRVTENRSVPHPPITGGLTWNYLWKGSTWELSGTVGSFYIFT